jgi:uncharacterized membrane protein YgdD (TMEM256/DUF423 family)
MNKGQLAAGAIFAAMGVALGAFGAHGLQNVTSDEKIIHGYQTGVEYQLWHAFALFVTGILARDIQGPWLKRAAFCFVAGIVLFSGSLYLLTFLKIQESSLVKIAGPITPLGGLFFIAGWIFLLTAVLSNKK